MALDPVHDAPPAPDPGSPHFTLHGCVLSALPDLFSAATHLTTVDLRGNYLVQLPPSFFRLVSLRVLYLGENAFQGLPGKMQGFQQLVFLDLSRNEFKSLSDATWLSTLTRLQVLDLRGNQLTRLPPHMGALRALRWLLVDDNPWTEPVLVQALVLPKRVRTHRVHAVLGDAATDPPPPPPPPAVPERPGHAAHTRTHSLCTVAARPAASPVPWTRTHPVLVSPHRWHARACYLLHPTARSCAAAAAPPAPPALVLASPNLTSGVLHREHITADGARSAALDSLLWYLRDLHDTGAAHEAGVGASGDGLGGVGVVAAGERAGEKAGVVAGRRLSAPDGGPPKPSTLSDTTRRNLYTELVRTEITYVAELAYAVEHYHDGFLRTRVLTPAECALVFGNYAALLAFHKALFFASARPTRATLGLVFQKHLGQLAQYAEYIASFDRATRMFRTWVEQRRGLRKFLEERRKDPQHRQLDFESYLFLPIQRVLRYKLFLESILQHTPVGDADTPRLVSAALALRRWSHAMNETLREQRVREATLEAYASIVGPLPALHPHRRLVRRGHLVLAYTVALRRGQLHQVPVHKSRMLVLFNDVLVVGRAKHTQCHLRTVVWLRTPAPASLEHGLLRVLDGHIVHYFAAPSEQVAVAWVEEINTRMTLC